MKIWIGVEVYQLIINDVHVFFTEDDARTWFKDYTGINYNDLLKKPQLLDEDHDQTKIFEVDIDREDPKTETIRQIQKFREMLVLRTKILLRPESPRNLIKDIAQQLTILELDVRNGKITGISGFNDVVQKLAYFNTLILLSFRDPTIQLPAGDSKNVQ